MNFTWLELIDRARVYADDDHKETPGWIAPEKWMALAQVEYRQLYRKWLRMGLINVEPTDLEFKGPSAKQRATVDVAALTSPYDAVIKTKVYGSAANEILFRLDDSGTGSGTLVNYPPDITLPAGANVFQFQPGVTTWGDLDSALTGSDYFDLITASTLPLTVFTLDEATFSKGGRDDVEGVLAIVGVAEAVDDGYRPLRAQHHAGRKPFRTNADAVAEEWSAFGAGDNLTIKLYPADTDSSRTYVLRYIEAPGNVTDTSLTVELPYMGDERLVLGILQRAGIKEASRLGLVDKAILDADAELAIEANSKDQEGGRRVRINPRPPRSTPSAGFPYSRYFWLYF